MRISVAFLIATLVVAACSSGSDVPSSPTTGSLTLTIQGLPSGTLAAVTVTGPDGYTHNSTVSEALAGLQPGSYTVVAASVHSPLYTFVPGAASLAVTVAAGTTATGTVAYAATTGALQIDLVGVPGSQTAVVMITGPGGYSTTAHTATQLTDLAPGQYQFAVERIADRGMGYDAGTVAPATVTVGATANRTLTFDVAVLPRSTTDRPDDVTGPQYKVLYVVPADGVDRGLDTTRTLLRSIAVGERWLAGQTDGRHLRLDTYQGAVDFAFVRAPRTDAVMASYGAFMRDSLEKDLAAIGAIPPDKLYLVYYDGVNTTRCGSSALPPATPGRVTAIYLKGLVPGAPDCASNPLAASVDAAPGYLEFVMVHEMLHAQGVTTSTAPDYIDIGHVNNDPHDLMYGGSLPWTPSTLDVARRNYYNPAGLAPGLFNVATSPYLVP